MGEAESVEGGEDGGETAMDCLKEGVGSELSSIVPERPMTESSARTKSLPQLLPTPTWSRSSSVCLATSSRPSTDHAAHRSDHTGQGCELPSITNTPRSLRDGVLDSHRSTRSRKSDAGSGTDAQKCADDKDNIRMDKGGRRLRLERSLSAISSMQAGGKGLLQSPYLNPPTALQEKERAVEKKKAAERPEAPYRKRHLLMLKSLQDGAKKRVEEEAATRKLKEEERARLKARMGVENVESRLMQKLACQTSSLDGVARDLLVRKDEDGKKLPVVAPKEETEEERKRKAEAVQRTKALLEKNQQFLQKLAERRREEEEAAEALRSKDDMLKKKLREKVLEQVEKNREEAEKGGAVLSYEKPLLKSELAVEEAPEPRRGDIEKKIQNRIRRYQDRFGSEMEEEAWIRKKYCMSADHKMFCIAGTEGAYQGIRDALTERGWKEHREEDSVIFDLKWTVKTTDIPFKALNKEQIVNHFQKNSNLTTKVGLTRNLRSLKWFEDVDMDEFFPRSYDLHDPEELLDFLEDFKMVCAENVLKRFVRDGKDLTDQQGQPMGENYQFIVHLTCLMVDAYITRSQAEQIDDHSALDFNLAPEEWSLLMGEPCPVLDRAQTGAGDSSNAYTKRQRTVSYRPYASFRVDQQSGEKEDKKPQRKLKQKTDDELREMAEKLLAQLKEMNVQSCLNGLDNIWIIKPAGKSRGRDIMCARSINKILDYIGYGVAGKEMHWVVQKYLENPYLINGRKFDFRQWVLVTDWNPLSVWFYDECYLRFSMSDFTLQDLDNQYIHLCNNSIQKDGCDAEKILKESMWDLPTFRQHLIDTTGSNEAWENKILPRMKNISKWALMCAQDMLENRKNSCEVYGYDFMLDADFNVWLLEVNASPDMSASTQVTEKLTYAVLKDLVKVIIDHKEWYKQKKEEREAVCDTGNWSLIHKGEMEVSFPIAAFGCKLELHGDPIQIHQVYKELPQYTIEGSSRENKSQKLRQLEIQKAEEERNKEMIVMQLKKKKSQKKKRPNEDTDIIKRAGEQGGMQDEGEPSSSLSGWGEDANNNDELLYAIQKNFAEQAEAPKSPVAHMPSDPCSVSKKDEKDGGMMAVPPERAHVRDAVNAVASPARLSRSASISVIKSSLGQSPAPISYKTMLLGNFENKNNNIGKDARESKEVPLQNKDKPRISAVGWAAKRVGPANASERRFVSVSHKQVLATSTVTLGADFEGFAV